jgi:hypothetical protein
MTGIEHAPDIEIIDNEKIISEKISNCKSNCEINNTKLEGLLMLVKYDSKLENHDLDLAFDKNNNTFHIICDTIPLNTPLDISNLESTLSAVIQYIKLWEEKTLKNWYWLMKGFDLNWHPNKRVIIKNWIWWTAQREQIVLNTNNINDSEETKRNNNNISEDMYVFLQNILDPNGSWEIDWVCSSRWVSQECIDTLWTWANWNIVNRIKNIREASPEEIQKFN